MDRIVSIEVDTKVQNPNLRKIERELVNQVTSKIVPVIAKEVDAMLCAFEIALDESNTKIKVKICKEGESHDED